jgi:ankyrin repeat protein
LNADISIMSLSGETAFHVSAMNGKHEISHLLYEKHHVNIFEKDRLGKSLLEKTVENGFKELGNMMMLWSYYDLKAEELLSV